MLAATNEGLEGKRLRLRFKKTKGFERSELD